MAECFACLNDMAEADGCVSDRKIIIEGTVYDPIRHGESDRWGKMDFEANGECHDCGAKMGKIHHPGCDMEECPNCGGQYFICDCHTDEKEEIWGEQ
jgi:hypothetical protein